MSSLAFGLAVALVASVALNGSYLMQHAGAARAPAVTPLHPVATMRGLIASRIWLVGGVIGTTGWGLHVVALSHAPLSLVQAFVSGGLVLCVPLAIGVLHHRLTRAEQLGVAVMAAALVALSLGLHARTDHHVPAAALAFYLLGSAVLAAGVVVLAPAGAGRPQALGTAAGLLYGAGDMAIKALTSVGATGGFGAVLRSPWLEAMAFCTVAAFFCFQRGLQTGRALPVIALMTAATNTLSIAGGLIVFGDPLGHSAGLVVLHLVGFALVGVAAWQLAPTQAALTTGAHEDGKRFPRRQASVPVATR